MSAVALTDRADYNVASQGQRSRTWFFYLAGLDYILRLFEKRLALLHSNSLILKLTFHYETRLGCMTVPDRTATVQLTKV